MAEIPSIPRRPYLLRAMQQWMSDSGLTPHMIVDAEQPGTDVPRAHIKDGKIVLNISDTATQRLNISNDWVEFDARFSGVIYHVRCPTGAVLGIYARETGEGMVFSEADGPADPPNKPTPAEEGASRRPQLKVVK